MDLAIQSIKQACEICDVTFQRCTYRPMELCRGLNTKHVAVRCTVCVKHSFHQMDVGVWCNICLFIYLVPDSTNDYSFYSSIGVVNFAVHDLNRGVRLSSDSCITIRTTEVLGFECGWMKLDICVRNGVNAALKDALDQIDMSWASKYSHIAKMIFQMIVFVSGSLLGRFG